MKNSITYRFIILPLLAGFTVVFSISQSTPSAKLISYVPGKEPTKLANTDINESSGLACSRLNNDVFWTHNDSGDKPRIFAFDKTGRDLGEFILKERLRDCEDISSVLIKSKAYLIIGDVGDNNKKRTELFIYLVNEPKVRIPTKQGTRKVSPKNLGKPKKITYSYEDGPNNCEAISIDPTTGLIYIVSKVSGKQCKLYELASPLSAKQWKNKSNVKQGKRIIKAIGTLNIPTTTGMDISADGLRMLVLTYGNAFEYTRNNTRETWADAVNRKPRVIIMPKRPQGESVCYGSDGKTIYLTSECAKKEKSGCPFYIVSETKRKAAAPPSKPGKKKN